MRTVLIAVLILGSTGAALAQQENWGGRYRGPYNTSAPTPNPNAMKPRTAAPVQQQPNKATPPAPVQQQPNRRNNYGTPG
jgi:hypothetical protein